MKNLQTLFNCLVISVLLFTSYCCSKQNAVDDILTQAENIVEQQPDSALKLLNSVLFPEELNKNLFNKYNLLMIQAKDKSDKDITSDTTILEVKSYYIKKKDYPNAALAAFYCGRLRYKQKNMEKAIEAYMEAEKLSDNTDNYNLKGLIQGNLGTIHRDHFSKEKAIEFYKNAIKMYDKVQNHRNIISTIRSIGDCFLLSKNTDSAFYYYEESLKLAEQYNMPKLQSDINQSMGVAFRELRKYEKAKTLFEEALTFPRDSIEQSRILLNIARVYLLENNLDSVNYYLDKSLALQIRNPALMRTSYDLKSNVAEKNKQYQEALNYHKKYYDYTIQVFDIEKNNKLIEIQEKYDYEKLKNSQNQLIIKQQKIAIILSFALLAAVIVIFLYYRNSLRNKRLLLETKQKVTELQKLTMEYSEEKQSFRNILLQNFNIMKKIALIESEITEDERKSGQKLIKKINKIVYERDNLIWTKIYITMNKLQDGFYDKMKEKYIHWNETEFRIFCMTYEDQFSDNEIAVILNKTVPMVRKIRNKIRKDTETPKYSHHLNS